jgi:hypothetical protein
MGIPLFVVSPNSFENPPPGNRELINRGGIEIQPENGITTLLKYIEKKSIKEAKLTSIEKQISFLDKISV